jgi:hypothetical protein
MNERRELIEAFKRGEGYRPWAVADEKKGPKGLSWSSTLLHLITQVQWKQASAFHEIDSDGDAIIRM